jgi:PIN domain nuclease of toxin-antitoxin system
VNLLLDTHVLLWFAQADARLGSAARAAVRQGGNVSAITTWEIGIKQALGRLDAGALQGWFEADDYRELPFTSRHGRVAGALPPHHRDPFDRALVAQAQVEGLVLVTADPAVQQYDVALLDATR